MAKEELTPLQKLLKLKKDTEEGIKSRKNRSSYIPYFKCDAGDIVKVRILPIPFLELPFIAVSEHGGLFPKQKWRTVVCPRSVGEDECPICDFAFSHYKEAKEKKDEAAQELYKKYFPQRKIHCFLWNRKTEKVEHWAFFETMLGSILTEVEQAQVDISNLFDGRDGRIKAILGANGKKNITFALAEKNTPLFDDENKIKDVIDYIEKHKSQILDLKTPLENGKLMELLDFNGEEEEDDDEETPVEDLEAEDKESGDMVENLIKDQTEKKKVKKG